MRLVATPADPIEPSQDKIARRAFELWKGYFKRANDPVGNWLEAEAQLRAELNHSN